MWLAAVADDAELAVARADRRRNVLAVAEVLAGHAEWPRLGVSGGGLGAMTTRPTWAVLCERTGLSRACVAGVLAWLRGRELLGVVESGTTGEIRAARCYPAPDPYAGQGNRAAEYLLLTPTTSDDPTDPGEPGEPGDVDGCALEGGRQVGAAVDGRGLGHAPQDGLEGGGPAAGPAQEGTTTGTTVGTEVRPHPATAGSNAYAGAREAPPNNGHNLELFTSTARPVPDTRRGRLAAARAARDADPVLRRLSDRHVRSLLTPWWRAGWTTDDIRHALSWRPDGTPWPYAYRSEAIRHIPGWIRHRLAAWTLPDGTPAPSRTQQAQARRERAALERAAARATHAAARAHAADPAGNPEVARTRSLLARIALNRRPRTTPGPSPAVGRPGRAAETVAAPARQPRLA